MIKRNEIEAAMNESLAKANELRKAQFELEY